MTSEEINKLCEQVRTLTLELDAKMDSMDYFDEFENPLDIAAGAFFAKGHLEGHLVISEKTIPFIQATKDAFQEVLNELDDPDALDDGAEDEDE